MRLSCMAEKSARARRDIPVWGRFKSLRQMLIDLKFALIAALFLKVWETLRLPRVQSKRGSSITTFALLRRQVSIRKRVKS